MVTSLNETIFKVKQLRFTGKTGNIIAIHQSSQQTHFFFFNIRKFIFTTPYCLHSVIHNTHKTGLKLVGPTGCQLQFQRSCGFVFYQGRRALIHISWLWTFIACIATLRLKSAADRENLKNPSEFTLFKTASVNFCLSVLRRCVKTSLATFFFF